MNERFTLDSTVTEISENERVNKKLPIFFDLALCSQIKWPFSKMKLKNQLAYSRKKYFINVRKKYERKYTKFYLLVEKKYMKW